MNNFKYAFKYYIVVAIILVVAVFFIFFIKNVSGVSGKYSYDSKCSIELKKNGTCTWYQDDNSFEGKYVGQDSGYSVNLNELGSFSILVIDDNNLLINNHTFTKSNK